METLMKKEITQYQGSILERYIIISGREKFYPQDVRGYGLESPCWGRGSEREAEVKSLVRSGRFSGIDKIITQGGGS